MKEYRFKDLNKLVGDLFGISAFLALICGLNSHSFDVYSFCLMNPRENLCQAYREGLNCKNHFEFNLRTGNGFYHAGYSGMFKTDKTGRVSFILVST